LDPRSGLDDVERRQFFTLPVLELRSLGRLARNQSLYRLSYPGSLILKRSSDKYSAKKSAKLNWSRIARNSRNFLSDEFLGFPRRGQFHTQSFSSNILLHRVTVKWSCYVAWNKLAEDDCGSAAARVRVRAACGGQSGTGAGFLRVLRFPLPNIPPISPLS
jgi:hypothetical protein